MINPKVIERSEIETLIPHRPPFLWIDRVEELEPGVRCVAVKFVEPVFDIFVALFIVNRYALLFIVTPVEFGFMKLFVMSNGVLSNVNTS